MGSKVVGDPAWPSSKRNLRNLVVCLHIKGINLVKLGEGEGHTHCWACHYKTPSLESLDSSHIGWGGGRKVGDKKSKHLRLSPSSSGYYFGSDRMTNLWWVLYHWKTCLDHHCRSDRVPLCCAGGPRVYTDRVRRMRFLTRLRFLDSFMPPLLDRYQAQVSLLIRSGHLALDNIDINCQTVGHGIAPTAKVAVTDQQ